MTPWIRLSRGTLELKLNGCTAQVWKVGEGVRFTVDNGEIYLAGGVLESEDAACTASERAIFEHTPKGQH